MLPTFEPSLELIGWLHLFFFGIYVPFVAWRRRGRLRSVGPECDRRSYYRQVIVTQIFFAGISAYVGWRSGIILFPARLPSVQNWFVGLGLLVVLVAVMRPVWRRRSIDQSAGAGRRAPHDAVEIGLWLLVSLCAGVGEEITWRGVQTSLAAFATNCNLIAAVAFATFGFAVAHINQGVKAVAIIAGFAVAFHLVVWLSGSLYVAMAVHFLYDAIAGLHYSHYMRRFHPPQAEPSR